MHACMYTCFSHVQLFESAHRTLCTVAHQSLLSMGLSRQEYWSGLCHALLQGSSQHRDQIWVSCFGGRFFIAQSQGKTLYYAYIQIYTYICTYDCRFNKY